MKLYIACISSQYHWDKAFHFPGKFHFLVKTITYSVRLGVVYLNLVLSTASGVMFLSTVCGPHHHDPRFMYFFYFQVFFNRSPILDPRSSILAPGFPVNLEVIKIVLFFDHWTNQLFQSNLHFQAIEFVKRPVPEKLDMGFLFYGHDVTSDA